MSVPDGVAPHGEVWPLVEDHAWAPHPLARLAIAAQYFRLNSVWGARENNDRFTAAKLVPLSQTFNDINCSDLALDAVVRARLARFEMSGDESAILAG